MTTPCHPRSQRAAARRDDAAAVRACARRRHGAPQPAVLSSARRPTSCASTCAFEAAEAGLRMAWRFQTAARRSATTARRTARRPPTRRSATAIRLRRGQRSIHAAHLGRPGRTGRFAGGLRVATDDGWSCSRPAGGLPVILSRAAPKPPAPRSVSRSSPRRAVDGSDRRRHRVLQFGAACTATASGARARTRATRVQATVAPRAGRGDAADRRADGPRRHRDERRDDDRQPGSGRQRHDRPCRGTIALPAANPPRAAWARATPRSPHVDPALAATEAERLLTALLGIDRALAAAPGVRSIGDCGSNCAAAIGEASLARASRCSGSLGDLVLDGPLTLGNRPSGPLLLVVDGQVRLQPGVSIHGVVVTPAPTWDTSGSADTQVHGALVALGDGRGDGTPTIVRDAGVLARLHGGLGTLPASPAAGATSDVNPRRDDHEPPHLCASCSTVPRARLLDDRTLAGRPVLALGMIGLARLHVDLRGMLRRTRADRGGAPGPAGSGAVARVRRHRGRTAIGTTPNWPTSRPGGRRRYLRGAKRADASREWPGRRCWSPCAGPIAGARQYLCLQTMIADADPALSAPELPRPDSECRRRSPPRPADNRRLATEATAFASR